VASKKPVGIKRSSDFLRIKTKGKKKTLSHWLMMTYLRNDLGHFRHGCTVSRHVGNAVVRNKLKRWSREFFRKMAVHGFNPEYDINLVFRPMQEDFYKKLLFREFCEVLEPGCEYLVRTSS